MSLSQKTLAKKLHGTLLLTFSKSWKSSYCANILKRKVNMALAYNADMNPELNNGNNVM